MFQWSKELEISAVLENFEQFDKKKAKFSQSAEVTIGVTLENFNGKVFTLKLLFQVKMML